MGRSVDLSSLAGNGTLWKRSMWLNYTAGMKNMLKKQDDSSCNSNLAKRQGPLYHKSWKDVLMVTLGTDTYQIFLQPWEEATWLSKQRAWPCEGLSFLTFRYLTPWTELQQQALTASTLHTMTGKINCHQKKRLYSCLNALFRRWVVSGREAGD